jgi:hypothetical protein
MGTAAIFPVALVLGWLSTLSLARDVARLELTDFLIATGGALVLAVWLPRMGFEIWGEYGLRLTTVGMMEAAAVLTLMAANLARGRGLRAGALEPDWLKIAVARATPSERVSTIVSRA